MGGRRTLSLGRWTGEDEYKTHVTERGGKEAPRSLAIWPESFLIELRTRDRVWGICFVCAKASGLALSWSGRCPVMARSRDDIMPFVNTLCRLLKSEMNDIHYSLGLKLGSGVGWCEPERSITATRWSLGAKERP